MLTSGSVEVVCGGMEKGKEMIGYLQLYFKIIGEIGTYYSSFEGDFSKPVTRFKLYGMKRAFKKVYAQYDKIRSVTFCSKEEYEKHRRSDDITYKW